MVNELIFFVQTTVIACSVAAAYHYGKEALISTIALLCVLGNLFVLKQTTLFGFNATCADAFAVGATIGLALLQQQWGTQSAQQSIIINFCALGLYTATALIHLHYHPSSFDHTHEHFMILLSPAPRIIVASICAYFVSQQTTIYLQKRHNVAHNRLYTYFVVGISHTADTLVFSCVGLYGLIGNLSNVIAISMCIKYITICIVLPLVNSLQQAAKNYCY